MIDPAPLDAVIHGGGANDVGFENHPNLWVQCQRCGQGENLKLPLPVLALDPWLKYFAERHRYCEKEPYMAGKKT